MGSLSTTSSENHAQHLHNVTFSADGFRLSGTLHLPGTQNPPVVIGSHGLVATSDSPKQIALAQRCTASGIAYFRFDHRGCGASQGVFDRVTSLEARCSDLLCAIECVRGEMGLGGPIGLFGSSMGGAVCIAACSKIDPACLAIYAAPVRSRTLTRPGAGASASNPAQPPGRRRGWSFDLAPKLSDLHHILVIHGDADKVVPFADAEEIYTHAGEPKKLIVQPVGDHPMSHVPHQQRFVRDVVDWFRAWLFA